MNILTEAANGVVLPCELEYDLRAIAIVTFCDVLRKKETPYHCKRPERQYVEKRPECDQEEDARLHGVPSEEEKV